jgi:adenylate cyclase class 2
MGYEVELKFRGADHDDLARRLAELGAESGPEIDQEDVYLAHPARDFAQTNEALRLRREGGESRVTYKGPRLTGPTKTREEVEVTLASGPEALTRMTLVFQNLGFRHLATLHKSRRPYHLTYRGRPLEIALDSAESLGSFVEVEALATGPDDLPAAQVAVLDLSRVLGLTDVEPRSYLRMVLEQGRG